MRCYFYLAASLALSLTACSIPPPSANLSIEQAVESDLNRESTIALQVENQAEDTSVAWALSADEAAEQLSDKVRFALIDSGVVHQVVAPADEAAYDMTISIMDFEHEAPSVDTSPDAERGDGLNTMTAEVRLVNRETRQPAGAFEISATSASEAVYGQYGPVGVEQMLNAAANGIVEGLRKTSAFNPLTSMASNES